MTKHQRDEGGKFTEKTSLNDVLELFETGEPLTSTEVGEHLNITRRSALNKLNKLYERGDVDRKQVGARAVVWWTPLSGRR